MSDKEYDEDLRLAATCKACSSDRVYQTEMLAGFGVPVVAAIECAVCGASGESWENPAGRGWLVKWDGADEVTAASYVTSD
jgi:hypothetical protein